MKYNTFEQFRRRAFKDWIVQFPEEKDGDLSEGVCTCPHFFKNYVCKHILGVAIRSKKFKVPAEAKDVPIGLKRKRGRPKSARKARLVN